MNHNANVAHHTRGRLRMKIPRARQNAAALQEIAQALSATHGVSRVETNLNTGSVTIYYDHEVHADFQQSLTEQGRSSGLFSLQPPEVSDIEVLAANIEREAEYLAEHSDAARHIVNAAKALNDGLRRATNNNVDLKVLLPLGLAAWALVEHNPEITTPLWVTLSVFSFNSFVALHPPQSMVSVTDQAVAVEAASTNLPAEGPA